MFQIALFKGFPDIPHIPLPPEHSVGRNEATRSPTRENPESWQERRRPREICCLRCCRFVEISHNEEHSKQCQAHLGSPTLLRYHSPYGSLGPTVANTPPPPPTHQPPCSPAPPDWTRLGLISSGSTFGPFFLEPYPHQLLCPGALGVTALATDGGALAPPGPEARSATTEPDTSTFLQQIKQFDHFPSPSTKTVVVEGNENKRTKHFFIFWDADFSPPPPPPFQHSPGASPVSRVQPEKHFHGF